MPSSIVGAKQTRKKIFLVRSKWGMNALQSNSNELDIFQQCQSFEGHKKQKKNFSTQNVLALHASIVFSLSLSSSFQSVLLRSAI
jgi:hypothetical protein